MEEAFEAYRALLEKEGSLAQKTEDHAAIIDSFYASNIVQVENTASPIKGKQQLKAIELKNLLGVKSVKTLLKDVVIDTPRGIVWGEMIIHFDSIQYGKKRIEEAFVQYWENNQIIYQRFFYGDFVNVNAEEKS